jgi:hypothetical protein
MHLGTKDYRRTTFAARHRPVVRALAEAFFSPDGEVDDARLDALVDEVDRFVSPASKTLRFGLLLVLHGLNLSPLLFGRFRTFAALPNADRIHHLERLEGSRIAQLPLLVVSYKTMMTMLFYDDPEAQRSVGYSAERRRWRRTLPALEPRP